MGMRWHQADSASGHVLAEVLSTSLPPPPPLFFTCTFRISELVSRAVLLGRGGLTGGSKREDEPGNYKGKGNRTDKNEKVETEEKNLSKEGKINVGMPILEISRFQVFIWKSVGFKYLFGH